MMIKRMGKHPLYWGLLLLFPAALFAVPRFNRAAEKEQIPVGYVLEGTDAGQMERNIFQSGSRNFSDESLFQYIKYTDAGEMKADIETGEISCGAFFDAEFTRKLEEQDYYHCITLYLPEGMNAGGIVQEDLFQRVYRAHSAVWYAELLGQQGYQIKPEEVLQKFSEYQREGKVFAINYEGQSGNEEGLYNGSEGTARGAVLPLRGILAFLTLASSLLGALEGSRDRRRHLGKGIGCPNRLAMAAAGAPILPAVLFLAAGMMLSGSGQMGILPELISALLYGLILWLAAMVFGRFLPEKLLEGAMPCFLLIVLLCCPVFFNLGETIPLIGGLSKLFPITWYLEFWG